MSGPFLAPDGTDVRQLRALAERAARAGGELVRERPELVEVAATKSSETDVVTAMDTACERLLRQILLAERPDDAILGEEGGSSRGGSGVTWVIDPVDGTVNYLYGIPAYAVSVAAVAGTAGDPRRWRLLAGCVHNPVTGETWTAARGAGASLDGRPLRPAQPLSLAQALVATGFSYDRAARAWQVGVLAALLPRVRDVRRIGSAAMDLCFVASGRADAYYEHGLKPWDLAAGALVVQESGARLLLLDGMPGELLTVAVAPSIAVPFLGLLGEIDAARGRDAPRGPGACGPDHPPAGTGSS